MLVPLTVRPFHVERPSGGAWFHVERASSGCEPGWPLAWASRMAPATTPGAASLRSRGITPGDEERDEPAGPVVGVRRTSPGSGGTVVPPCPGAAPVRERTFDARPSCRAPRGTRSPPGLAQRPTPAILAHRRRSTPVSTPAVRIAAAPAARLRGEHATPASPAGREQHTSRPPPLAGAGLERTRPSSSACALDPTWAHPQGIRAPRRHRTTPSGGDPSRHPRFHVRAVPLGSGRRWTPTDRDGGGTRRSPDACRPDDPGAHAATPPRAPRAAAPAWPGGGSAPGNRRFHVERSTEHERTRPTAGSSRGHREGATRPRAR
jgi:hypothetical protein